ncbi:hypothetical protein SRHO_G00118050 [Serrasalmus rhombeus]
MENTKDNGSEARLETRAGQRTYLGIRQETYQKTGNKTRQRTGLETRQGNEHEIGQWTERGIGQETRKPRAGLEALRPWEGRLTCCDILRGRPLLTSTLQSSGQHREDEHGPTAALQSTGRHQRGCIKKVQKFLFYRGEMCSTTMLSVAFPLLGGASTFIYVSLTGFRRDYAMVVQSEGGIEISL